MGKKPSANGVDDIVLTATGEQAGGDIRFGRATEHLPALAASDLVYAAGAPEMVEAIKHLAHLAGAECHADPFTVSPNAGSVFDRIRRAMRAPGAAPASNPLSPRPAVAPAGVISLPAAAARHAAVLERSAPGAGPAGARLSSRASSRAPETRSFGADQIAGAAFSTERCGARADAGFGHGPIATASSRIRSVERALTQPLAIRSSVPTLSRARL
jgi:hypothetical protein